MAEQGRLVLLGPPGSGKGTQAKLLIEQCSVCQISTGDILRKAVAEQTRLGKEAAEYINRGALVPDNLIIRLVAERLKQKDCDNGFVLDGFPRTIPQAESLDVILRESGQPLNRVLLVQVPRSILLERLAGRRSCRNCGAPAHVIFNAPRREGICDLCGGELEQRDDDREETVTRRLEVYENQTAPLVNYYRQRGVLAEIDGIGTIEEVHARISKSLGDAPK